MSTRSMICLGWIESAMILSLVERIQCQQGAGSVWYACRWHRQAQAHHPGREELMQSKGMGLAVMSLSIVPLQGTSSKVKSARC